MLGPIDLIQTACPRVSNSAGLCLLQPWSQSAERLSNSTDRSKEVWKFRSPNDRDRICKNLEDIQKRKENAEALASQLGYSLDEATIQLVKTARKIFKCDTKDRSDKNE